MPAAEPSESLTVPQKLHLLASFQYADRLLAEIESILAASRSRSPFPKYRPDLTPTQAKVVEDYIARLRAQMVRALAAVGIEPPEAQFGALHSIRVTLSFADIAFEECRPKCMRGYGELPAALVEEMNGAVDELQSLIARLDAYLAQGLGADLARRLEMLDRAGADLRVVRTLERIIRERGLVEFRPTLAAIIERMESGSFEIAVFGRVSSGKSSLLNYVLGTPVLPVGVTPITAVPTRVAYGPAPRGRVWLAGSAPEEFALERLAEFVSETLNPANVKNVTRIVIELPAERLRDGVVFVDTPGLGSLAAAGAEETRAYLPRCDMGVVLLDAGSTLTPEDLATIQALYENGVPASVVLSKADLLEPGERERMLAYIAEHIRAELGLELPVHPVSVKPGHTDLVEAWFEQEILPLYARRQELAERSIKRKVAALKSAVEAALEARLKHSGRTSEIAGTPLRELESTLRKASGAFSEARARCLRITDEVRHSSVRTVERAAAALVAEWTQSQPSPASASEILEGILQQMAAEPADTVTAILKGVAREATAALRHAAVGLNLAENLPEEGELVAGLSELPRLDPGRLELTLKPNRWLLALAPALERRRVERQLRVQVGPRLSAAFGSHGRVLEAWVRRKFAELESLFESYAETYRAQLDRLAGEGAGAPEEQEALRRDLAELAGHAAPAA